MKIEIWSDVVCPWCYIGKRHFEAALASFAHRDRVAVVWRSFELDPSAPAEREGPYAERLSRKYGVPVEHAQGMIDRMTEAAAEAGLAFRFDIARPGNTFDAHRVLHLAAERGVQDALKERFLAATFEQGEPIGDHDTLVRLATEVGLDADEVRAVLESGRHADAVRADEHEATELGITGVPYFVIDRAFAVSGAQAPETMLAVLERAWARHHAPTLVVTGGGDGPECEGDTCAV